MGRVGIIGVGHSRFGKRSDASLRELAFEAYREALDDAEIDTSGIDGTRRGCNVGVALRHDHARVLRNVCQRPYGAIWHDSGTDGLSPSQESEIRDQESKGDVSETR